jgi:hypothetical protein
MISAEERNALLKDLIARLVDSLMTIYDGYERFMYEQALAAGQPPPVKKLRLASNSVNSVASPAPAPPPTTPPKGTFTNIVNVLATVHDRDLDSRGYNVAMPYLLGGNPDDSDDESSEDPLIEERKTFFLTRTRCTKCATSAETPGFHGLPEFITWKDVKNVPDGCPICQKVLFTKSDQKVRPHEHHQ